MTEDQVPINYAERLVGSSQLTVPEILVRRKRATPDAPFLSYAGKTWTYAEALDEMSGFAGWLRTQPSGRVAGFLPNRPEAVIAWLGTLVSGRTYVPLNRAHKGPLLEDLLTRSRAQILITDQHGAEVLGSRLEDFSAVVLDPPAMSGASLPVVKPGLDLAQAAYEIRPSDPAEILFTSGTVGRSKAAIVPQNALARGAGWVCWSAELDGSDIIHCWMPIYHVGAQVDLVLAAIVAGSSVALFERFSVKSFWDQVAQTNSTVFGGFGNIAEWLYARSGPRESSLRLGLIGATPRWLHSDFEERFSVRLIDIYGMSEAEPLVFPRPGRDFPPGSCGLPSPDWEIAIADASDVLCPPGEVGEIVARPRIANVLMRGYENDDAATAEAMRNLWFHTGDRGRTDRQGFVYFIDRKKYSIRRGNENVSSWEVENTLATHPAILECSVLGIPDDAVGEEVKAVVVPAAAIPEVNEAALYAWCQQNLPSFMVPRYIEIRGELPRDGAGKVRKRDLGDITMRTWDAHVGSTASR